MEKKRKPVIERIGGGTGPLQPGEPIMIKDGNSTLFTVYRPPRRRDESPVKYYKRTGCVDDRFTSRHKGRYYCNPAHCSRSWDDRKKRDEHLDQAYAALS